MSATIVFFSLLFFSSCSPVVQNQAEPIILDKDTTHLIKETKVLQGTGRVLFDQPLFNLFSKELYFVTAELSNENSSLILHSHFTGFTQIDGIKVFFIRDKTHLTIKVSTPNYPIQTLYTNEKYFTQNQTVQVYIEVQNGTENTINLKIWDTYINPTGYLKELTHTLTRQNILVDSGHLIFYSKGQGMLWGVELDRVRLIKISRESQNQ